MHNAVQNNETYLIDYIKEIRNILTAELLKQNQKNITKPMRTRNISEVELSDVNIQDQPYNSY